VKNYLRSLPLSVLGCRIVHNIDFGSVPVYEPVTKRLASIWLQLQRNARVFRGEAATAQSVIQSIEHECDQWCRAKLLNRSMLLGI
jgi:hypothetical protein